MMETKYKKGYGGFHMIEWINGALRDYPKRKPGEPVYNRDDIMKHLQSEYDRHFATEETTT